MCERKYIYIYMCDGCFDLHVQTERKECETQSWPIHRLYTPSPCTVRKQHLLYKPPDSHSLYFAFLKF